MTTVNGELATKADVIELEDRLDHKLASLEDRLDHKMDHKLERLELKLDQKLDQKLTTFATKADLEAWGLRLFDLLGGAIRAANEEMRDWMRAHAEETRTRWETVRGDLDAHRTDARVHRSSRRRG